ncbi:MAG: PQQ-binding-like beta-propeller repeat protein [Prolixibacteraceae bacterium]|nr:PQQ-binding-like beta-propeller repeat protein [Prolixibacteraceae bacterium]
MKTQKTKICPGIIIALLLLLIRYFIPWLIPNTTVIGIFGGIILCLAIFVWWLFFSKAALKDRLSYFVLVVVSLVIASFFLHKSIATANMGLMFILFSIPVSGLAFVAGLLITQKMAPSVKRLIMIAIIILSSGIWILLRTEGMTGEGRQKITWRWSETAEEKFLESTGLQSDSGIAALESNIEWPGFRGKNRNSIYPGTIFKPDWKTSPPVEIWRKAIGSGCSSFAIGNKYFYTQEQHGEYELVTCYRLKTGEQVWSHADSARFWDSHAGAGPRSTPTICNEYLYTLGATGILNALNISNGKVAWSRNAANDTGKEIPGWGFTSSPLIIDDLVYIALTGRMAAYNRFDGELMWMGTDGGGSYSSPHHVIIDSTSQILLMSQAGLTSFDPVNGNILWQHVCPEEHIVQPALIDKNDLLISAGLSEGMRRLSVSKTAGDWDIDVHWTSPRMKTNFNDFVIHKGYLYGYHGPLLCCLNLENGEVKWKGGRYSGQSILLPDQDLIIVLTERGELAMVSATPDEFNEISKIKVLNDKTWNHPAIAGNILLVRNSVEMVAFKLP